jgi:hypothetical protein
MERSKARDEIAHRTKKEKQLASARMRTFEKYLVLGFRPGGSIWRGYGGGGRRGCQNVKRPEELSHDAGGTKSHVVACDLPP